jgi:prepilin-type N-terminal cleavage/methylation domain-containing protein
MRGTLDIRKFDIRGRNEARFASSPLSHYPNPPISIFRRNGFTLIELVLALLLIALLIGMVFSTARSSLVLGNNVVKTQNEEMLHQAFFDFLENRISALPGNTRMELIATDSGSHYLSDLTLQNVPLSFTWGGEERTAKSIRLSTVKRRSGFLDIVLSYYENEIIEPDAATTNGSAFASSAVDEKPFAEIILLTDVAYFEWRVLDGRTMEYQYDWDIAGRLPLQMELICAFGADGGENRQVFWIPPRQNPEVFMRQMQQGQGQGGGGTQPGTPGGGDTPPVEIIPPGGGRPITPPNPGNR